MNDSDERHDVPMSNPLTDSPPSVKDDKNEGSDVFLSDSSHLDTELLPSDENTNCPHCHGEFRKPRVLDCLHSMCEDCIILQLKGRRETQKVQELPTRDATDFELEMPKIPERPIPSGVIRCPICSQETRVGNDICYVRTMLLDYVRFNHKELYSSVDRKCCTCNGEQPAVAFCKQCQSDLCSNCLAAHGRMRMFEGHGPNKNGVRREGDAIICPRHHNPFKVLCATCEHLACKTCLEIEHLHHKVIEVSDRVVIAIEQEIQNLVSSLDAQWKNNLAEWSATPDHLASLHGQYETTKARLEFHFEQLAQSLEHAKQRKMKELEDARQKQEHAIEELYSKMNLNETRVNDALGFTRRLLEKANGMELLVSRKKVVHQLNNLSQTMPSAGVRVELEYSPLPKKQADQQLNALSRMVSSTKEAVSTEQIRPSMDYSSSSSDWSRLNGSTTSTVNLPAIGTERKKVPRGSTDCFGAWFPSANPPDLPSVSPMDMKEIVLPNPTGSANLIPGVSYPISSATGTFYNNSQWPLSSNPSLHAPAVNNLPPVMAARQQYLALMQSNALNNNQSTAAIILQQASRIRAAVLQQQQQRNDPVLSSLSSMSLDNFDRTSSHVSPEASRETRLCELKTHSVFGISTSGSNINELHCPSGFCISKTDDILIADTNNHRVIVCGPPSPWKIGNPGTEDGMLCFPRKVIALHNDVVRYVIFDKGADAKTRAQLFDSRGEFIKRINLVSIVSRGSIEITATTSTNNGHLVLVDNEATVFCIDIDASQLVYSFDASSHLGEASDVVVSEKLVYITDFKNHCVQVFNIDGAFVRKLGEPAQTPYPIGIDISKNGDIYIADTHGNHLHVVVFSDAGQLIQSFTHNEFRLSRCVGLRLASTGHLVTLCKHNHTLFVFKPLPIG